jgi:hypothetical protein
MRKAAIIISCIVCIAIYEMATLKKKPKPKPVHEWSHTYCEPHYTGDGF